MTAAEYLDRFPSEESIRQELGDTLKRAEALRELLKVAKRLPQQRTQSKPKATAHTGGAS